MRQFKVGRFEGPVLLDVMILSSFQNMSAATLYSEHRGQERRMH